MAVIKNLRQNLAPVFKAGDEHVVLMVTGSGTAANETVISSAFTPQDEVLVVAAGEFGYRLAELMDIHEVPNRVLGYEWGAVPSAAGRGKRN